MSTASSRSAAEFMKRHGIKPSSPGIQPQFNFGGLEIHSIPLERDQLNPNLMRAAAGDPPPDRGSAELWPPPQEVLDVNS